MLFCSAVFLNNFVVHTDLVGASLGNMEDELQFINQITGIFLCIILLFLSLLSPVDVDKNKIIFIFSSTV
jgi:hypothetical protein